MAPLKHGIYPTNLIKGPCRFIVSEGKFFFNNKSVKMTVRLHPVRLSTFSSEKYSTVSCHFCHSLTMQCYATLRDGRKVQHLYHLIFLLVMKFTNRWSQKEKIFPQISQWTKWRHTGSRCRIFIFLRFTFQIRSEKGTTTSFWRKLEKGKPALHTLAQITQVLMH